MRLMLPLVLAGLLSVMPSAPYAAGAPTPSELRPTPATASPIAGQAMMLGVAWAGSRVVAVGEHGIVLLSDDTGATVRQAKSVPVSSTLTSVSFVDARRGWAAGHWGAILATDDGGETWRVQRLAANEDRPLFAIHFFDQKTGVAVGLWSLILTTTDGGTTWSPQKIAPPPGATKADLNLLNLFADEKGILYAVAERGFVLRTEDRAATWTYLNTGYKGSFWSGIALPDGTLVVGGQRGTVYRSGDGGKQWGRVESGSKSSITGFAQRDGTVLAVGLDGLRLLSADAGRSFSPSVQPDRQSFTAALAGSAGIWITASRRGISKEGAP
jgi:photosystem II stability/assembly factor-like uncharacterized protein